MTIPQDQLKCLMIAALAGPRLEVLRAECITKERSPVATADEAAKAIIGFYHAASGITKMVANMDALRGMEDEPLVALKDVLAAYVKIADGHEGEGLRILRGLLKTHTTTTEPADAEQASRN